MELEGSDTFVFAAAQGTHTDLWGVWDRHYEDWAEWAKHEKRYAKLLADALNHGYAAGFADAMIDKAR